MTGERKGEKWEGSLVLVLVGRVRGKRFVRSDRKGGRELKLGFRQPLVSHKGRVEKEETRAALFTVIYCTPYA